MTAPSKSRNHVLERIRTATYPIVHTSLIERAYGELPRSFVLRGQLSTDSRISLLIERLREYDADVVESTSDQLSATIATQLALSGKQNFVAPPGLPEEWRAPCFKWQIDSELTYAEIDQADGVVTGAFCASPTQELSFSTTPQSKAVEYLPCFPTGTSASSMPAR
jgi:hypothetical protein